MKIVLVTDAWLPQINGVVRTLTQLRDQLLARGHEVHVIAPDLFPTVPLPTYAEIQLAVGADAKVGRMLWEFDPDAVHIATEGPLGLAARRYCIRRRLRFTTSFHTRFP
ncbi:MAG TPA: glycosyltransferase, partial [Gammaproteobacteria bacterium]|nr:glycosyltransferase [Gammaproteobacteria bacterium]